MEGELEYQKTLLIISGENWREKKNASRTSRTLLHTFIYTLGIIGRRVTNIVITYTRVLLGYQVIQTFESDHINVAEDRVLNMFCCLQTTRLCVTTTTIS